MRKIFLAAIFFILISTNICGAVERNEFSLGGIQLNLPYDDVIAMYGQPTSHPGGYAQLVSDVITYGDGVEIGFLGKKVRYVVTQKNNGWERRRVFASVCRLTTLKKFSAMTTRHKLVHKPILPAKIISIILGQETNILGKILSMTILP